MNYQESLARLNKEKEELEEKVGTVSPSSGDESNQVRFEREKLELVKKLIKGYSQSFAEEISGEKMNQVFKEVYGFEKQKEEAKTILLLQKYFQAKGIKDPESGKILCFVGPPGTGKTHFSTEFARAI
ncbi:13140_t:CDS:1, partial [Ambispora leptoticha]